MPIAFAHAAEVAADGVLPPAEPDPARARRELRHLCPTIYADLSEKDLKLEDMEARLACGDSTNDAIGRPWARVPPAQAGFFMRSFLQSRARHRARLTYDGDDLFVRGGPQSRLGSFAIRGQPDDVHLPKKREIQGRLLDPKLLNEFESWGQGEMKHQGYPCGRVEAEADPIAGAVRLNIAPGQRKRILSVYDVQDTGLEPFVLDRYDAFQVGQWYDQRLVELTRRRTLDDGVLESISFNPRCQSDGVIIEREAVLGPPRLARIGVGASTEEGARVRGSLKFLRLDGRASQAEGTIDLTFRRQKAETSLKWRYSDRFTRSYLEPNLKFEHDQEPLYESQTTTARFGHGWTFEFDSGSMLASLGPAWQETFLARGDGPSRESYFLADGLMSWQSHDYEYFKTSPRAGSQADVRALATQKSWGAGFTAQKISATGEWLMNVVDYDPPLFILAARWSLGTTFVSGDTSPGNLPLPFRFFAGGIQDLRGFDRQGLPGSNQGALTEALGGLEGRFYRAIFRRADPFVFVDAGKLGPQNMSFDQAIYWSPGLGVRYESPIGVFRVFVAQGIVDNPAPGQPVTGRQWRANVTFGEEF